MRNKMRDDNEEAWIFSTVKDFEYILEKYPEKVIEFSQDIADTYMKIQKAMYNNAAKSYGLK